MNKEHTETCAVLEFVNVFGDGWTLLIVREALFGDTRFGDFQKHTGVAKNILSNRLIKLVDNGILSKVEINERGAKYEYHLTEKGFSLVPVFIALMQWSTEYQFEKGKEPLRLFEKQTGKRLKKLVPTDHNGNTLGLQDIIAKVGATADQAGKNRMATSRMTA